MTTNNPRTTTNPHTPLDRTWPSWEGEHVNMGRSKPTVNHVFLDDEGLQ
jgi:hypothetical protein